MVHLHGGSSATLGNRNSCRRCFSSSCLSKYFATSYDVGVQPSCLDTLSITSLGDLAAKRSMTRLQRAIIFQD